MSSFTYIAETTSEAISAAVEKSNIVKETLAHLSANIAEKILPLEDACAITDDGHAFVVADGVTLDIHKLLADKKIYPNPSPAGQIAELFCQTALAKIESIEGEYSLATLKEIFAAGNQAVQVFNLEKGQSPYAGNKTGYFAATTSYMLIQNNRAYWARICDAYVAHYDQTMQLKAMTSGTCDPYAVVNGEPDMSSGLETGVWDIATGDRVFAFTDGFRHYFDEPDFLELLARWPDNIKALVADYSEKANLRDPARFGHDRTLIGYRHTTS